MRKDKKTYGKPSGSYEKRPMVNHQIPMRKDENHQIPMRKDEKTSGKPSDSYEKR